MAAVTVLAVSLSALIMLQFWPSSVNENLAPISASFAPTQAAIQTPSAALFGVSAESPSLSEVVKETTLSLQLKGVFPAQDPEHGMAIIASKGQNDGLFTVGEQVSRGVVLQAVLSDHVVILRGNTKETLFFERPDDVEFIRSTADAIPATSPVQAATDTGSGVLPGSARSAYQKMSGDTSASSTRSSHPLINDINQLSVAQMLDKYEERFKSNPQALLSSSGLEATGQSYKVTASSPLIGLGLRQGDEILSVNGQSVGNVSADAGLADVMRQQGVARIEMRRGSRRFFVNYPIR
ncbi:type II secretion system protein N [Marinomonas piezotolerans]|uniref:type II secretion system protein N n=1 Tax=Marinomonas piezotolerans TaxID=2213058 RepID=UPI001314B600|nr:type II secretion system protein N [Marinomonas piezotolerans]